jgi:formylglycine-generating enzyme required for sulfatase activity
MKTIVSVGAIALTALAVYAGPVTVTNVTAAQAQGQPVAEITYDLLNPSGGTHVVTIEVSTNGGTDFTVPCTHFSGDVGGGITTGTHKQVTWDAVTDLPAVTVSAARVRVTATDSMPDTKGMVYVPAGTFRMGDTFSEGGSDERPTRDVNISAFYIDKYEVSKAKWDEVANWAATNGYDITGSDGSGKGADHPVEEVTWYQCVKWCNARSEKEDLTPAYYTSSATTTVYRIGDLAMENDWVRWGTGYRLLTEAEWEKAARGGTAGMRFPWHDSQNIDFTRANYYSYWSGGAPVYSYDKATTEGYHPTWNTGTEPYTSPVGSFAATGYGVYDMAGNAWEWCWDRYGDNYYDVSPATNPRGPESGPYRVFRGGGWRSDAVNCRVAGRGYGTPDYGDGGIGFRACLPAGQ